MSARSPSFLRASFAAATASALAVQMVEPQEAPQPSFPTEAEVVTVDVVATGEDGLPVLDLGPEEFRVFEDDVRQEVVAFEAVHRPAPAEPAPGLADEPAPAPPPEPRSSTNQAPLPRRGNHFVVVFDELHLTPAEAHRAREAVREFLETAVAIGDRVALVGTAEGTRWTAEVPAGREALLRVLDRLQGRIVNETVRDRMTDYEAMRIDRYRDPMVIDLVMRRFLETSEIHQDTATPGNPTDPSLDVAGWRSQVQATAANAYARATARNEQTLGIVERTLEALAPVRERKSLIFVSGGLVNDPHLGVARRVVTAARQANAAIYFLDARGLVGVPFELQADNPRRTQFQDLTYLFTERRERSEGSEGLAADTGGFSVQDRNDLAGGLERIARESRSYYLLGYAPSNRTADGRFRSIRVKVAREGVNVRARRGYYAPGERTGRAGPVETADSALQRALDSPFDLAEVPLRAITHVFGEAAPGRATVQLTVEADLDALAFAEQGETARDTLELLLLVVQHDTGEFTRFDQQFEMKLSPQSRARYEATWFPITRELDLAPGLHQAKIVARDRNSGRVGSLTLDFEVPDLTGLRVSSLALNDRLHGDTPNGPGTLQLTARRRFAPSGLLHCRFEVYGAALDPATGRPNATAGFSIRRGDGRFLAAAAETPLQPAPDGTLARSLGVPLDGAPPGAYEVIVVVTDMVAGRSVVAREAFAIDAAS
jgi:VWFA-related protein